MPFKYFVAIEFASTLFMRDWIGNDKIIDFGAAVISLESGNIVDIFQRFVWQDVDLSKWCLEFNGVKPENLWKAKGLSEVLNNFDAWLEKLQVHPAINIESVFVTLSDYKLRSLLTRNCHRMGIPRPSYFNKWINLDRYAGKVAVEDALIKFGLEFDGTPRHALDDAKNMAILGYELSKRMELNITSTYN